MFDDVVVVMETEGFSVHRFVERPGVPRVFLGQHFSEEPRAETQQLLTFGRRRPQRLQACDQVVLGVRLRPLLLQLLGRTVTVPTQPRLRRDRR